jgi:hypothetical protein
MARARISRVDDVELANQQGRRGQKITSSRVKTLPKNLIRPLLVQDLEDEGSGDLRRLAAGLLL